MLEILKLLSQGTYATLELKPYEGKNIFVKEVNNQYQLIVNGKQWMSYNYITHYQASELFSHYHLAKGHCICTGMGFGVRENWLIQKKEVTKITIIEKNEQVLEYHKYINSPFLKECEVIIGDASEITGKCDTLLLDHYELESHNYIIDDVKKISNNVDCEALWFWPLERIIDSYKNDNKRFFNSSHYEIYLKIKNDFKLSKLPNINENILNLFCFLHLSPYCII